MCPSSPVIKQCFIDCAMRLDESKSHAIPLPESHIHRTESEQQLYEDMAVAEYRDRCMFNRLVSGIRQRQQLHYNFQRHAHYYDQQLQLQQGDGHDHEHEHEHEHKEVYHHGYAIHQDNEDSQQYPSYSPWPPSIQDTERSIENIISTRCKPVSSAPKGGRSISNNHHNQTYVQIPAWESKDAPPTTRVTPTRMTASSAGDDDWAIEGFDSPRPMPNIIQGEDISDLSDHVFDIEL